MRLLPILLAAVLAAGTALAGTLNVENAYHAATDDLRVTEKVPGEDFTFLRNGKTAIPDNEDVTLYVMTANNFADDADEQVFVRWWNGREEHWLMGSWEKNIFIGSGEKAVGAFRGAPVEGEVMLDLWKIVIPADKTLPGDNYYVIQLKGWSEDDATEYYLLRDMAVGGGENNVGQVWIATPDYAEHDWKVKITE